MMQKAIGGLPAVFSSWNATAVKSSSRTSKDLHIVDTRDGYREEKTMSPTTGLRIFVVDDEIIIAATVATIETCPNCKVLLFSGQAATLDLLSKARQLGHDFRLLLKPVHPTDLLVEVSNKLRHKTSAFEIMQGHLA